MKKMTTIALMLFSFAINAQQQWNGSTNATGLITRSGNVSVGTTANIDRFNLLGNFRLINGSILFGHNTLDLGPGVNSYYTFELISNSYFTSINTEGLYIHPTHNNINMDGSTPNQSKTLVLAMDNKIGMGTNTFTCSDCTDYRLFVKDGIKTEKVKVEIAANNGWADYVFKKDYKLMPLKELQSYIDEKGHLPEVPTTEEAIANGIELKEMNILLLKKIEELTLYTLQQQKNIEEQNKRIETLEKKLSK